MPATCLAHLCVQLACETDEDCAARGLQGRTCVASTCAESSLSAQQAANPWRCLGDVRWPAAETAMPTLTVRVIDVLTTQPPERLSVRLCPKLDVDCNNPLTGSFGFDEQQRLEIVVPTGFDGYIELTAPSITPALLFVTKPVWQDTELKSVLPMVSNEGFYDIAKAIGTTLDLKKLGHTYALATDCDGQPAAGVRFEVDRQTPSSAAYYMINNVPVSSANATDASGSGGFLNLQTGFTQIVAYVSATGARIGEAGFIVRAGTVSYPRLLPTP